MLTLIAQGAPNVINILPQATQISPVGTLGRLIELGAGAVLVVGGVAVLLYLILGGFNWITAGGDKAKVESARAMITQGIIGLAILASVFAVYGVLLRFFGITDRISITGGAGGGGNPVGGGQQPQTCAGGVAIGTTVNDGGAGGYCTGGGAALVTCVAAGVGPSGLPYPHFEPQSCIPPGQKAYNW